MLQSIYLVLLQDQVNLYQFRIFHANLSFQSDCFSGFIGLAGNEGSSQENRFNHVDYSKNLTNVLACGYSSSSKFVNLGEMLRRPIIALYDSSLNQKWIKQYQYSIDSNQYPSVKSCIFSNSQKYIVAALDQGPIPTTESSYFIMIANVTTGDVIRSFELIDSSVSSPKEFRDMFLNLYNDDSLVIAFIYNSDTFLYVGKFNPFAALSNKKITPAINLMTEFSPASSLSSQIDGFITEDRYFYLSFGFSTELTEKYATIAKYDLKSASLKYNYGLYRSISSGVQTQVFQKFDKYLLIGLQYKISNLSQKIGIALATENGNQIISNYSYVYDDMIITGLHYNISTNNISALVQLTSSSDNEFYYIEINCSSTLHTAKRVNGPNSQLIVSQHPHSVMFLYSGKAYIVGYTYKWSSATVEWAAIFTYPISTSLESQGDVNITLSSTTDILYFTKTLGYGSWSTQQSNIEYVYYNSIEWDDIIKDQSPTIYTYPGFITYKVGVTSYSYQVGSSNLSIPLKFKYSKQSQCDDATFSYVITMTPTVDYSTFLSFDGTYLNIFTGVNTYAGSYIVTIKAVLPNSLARSVKIALNITQNQPGYTLSTTYSAPYFTQGINNQTVTLAYTKQYTLPAFKDPDPSQTVTVSFFYNGYESLPSFVTYNQKSLTIKPTLESEIGVHTLIIRLENQRELENNYTIQIVVKENLEYITALKNQLLYTSNFMTKDDIPTLKTFKVNSKGIVTLELQYRQNASFIIPYKAFIFAVDPYQKLSTTMFQQSQDNTTFSIQLKFSNPLNVSSTSAKAILKISVNPYLVTKSSSTKRMLSSKFQYIIGETTIPSQLEDTKTSDVLDSVGTTFKGVTATIMISNLSITMLISTSMQLLWGFVNSLQLMANLPLLCLNIPSNLFYILSLIAGPLAFNIVDTTQFTLSLFYLDPAKYTGYNNQFTNFGFDNQIIMIGMSTSFYYFLISPLFLILIYILKTITKKIQNKQQELYYLLKQYFSIFKIRDKLIQNFQYSYFIRMMCEEFINVFLLSAINIIQIYNPTNFGEYFALIFAVLMMVRLFYILIDQSNQVSSLVVPTSLTIYLMKKQDSLDKEEVKSKIGSFYESVKTNRKISLLYMPLFVFRRLIFCLCALFLNDYPYFQIILFQTMTLLQMIYISEVQPFEDRLQNKMEVLNEGIVLIVSNFLVAFTDSVDNGVAQYQIGWLILGIIGFQCLINIIVQVKDIFQKIKRILWEKCKCNCQKKVKKDIDKLNAEGKDLTQQTQGLTKNQARDYSTCAKNISIGEYYLQHIAQNSSEVIDYEEFDQTPNKILEQKNSDPRSEAFYDKFFYNRDLKQKSLYQYTFECKSQEKRLKNPRDL